MPRIDPFYRFQDVSRHSVIAVTTTATPGVSDSQGAYTNEGDLDGATVTLPAAEAGLTYIGIVQTAQILTIMAATGDTIRIAGNVSAAGGGITSNVVGSVIILLAINATEWIAISCVGSWNVQET